MSSSDFLLVTLGAFVGSGVFRVLEYGLLVLIEWRAKRKVLRAMEEARLDFHRRLSAVPKRKILKVGKVCEVAPGAYTVVDWAFEEVPGVSPLTVDALGNVVAVGGYSIPELRAIAANPDEWEVK